MSSISDILQMLSAMKKATTSLVTAGLQEDASVVAASESIMRAHFAKYFSSVEREVLNLR